MAGPVNLDFVKAKIAQDFATPAGNLKVDADRVFVEWGGLGQPVQLVFRGLRVTNAEQAVLATAPSVALSFDPRVVIWGEFLPTAIVVDRPTLDADLAREGGMLRRVLAKGDPSSQVEVVDLLIEQLLAEPNHKTLLGQLDTVKVERAKVTLRDVPSGMLWI